MDPGTKKVLNEKIREEILSVSADLGCSPSDMAGHLGISLRSYEAIIRGERGCSSVTLLLFLARCCPDPNAFAIMVRDSLSALAFSPQTDIARCFRQPWAVAEKYRFPNQREYPICPRCKSTLEWEYQSFCDRCGQRLSWRQYETAEVCLFGKSQEEVLQGKRDAETGKPDSF